MYTEHPVFRLSKAVGKPIWRYMDFWKFLNLLETSSIHFSNSESLGDNYEGRLPRFIIEQIIELKINNSKSPK